MKSEKHTAKLEVIHENENIIPQVSRDEIHDKGLLHREVHVWLYTPEGKIIFQKRSATKDTYPSLLDASVGGHIDIGNTPEQTAVIELQEETGIVATIDELNFIEKTKSISTDIHRNRINNVIRYVYSYRYEGNVGDIIVEEGKATDFLEYSLEDLENLESEERESFIPAMIRDKNILLYQRILK